MLFGLDSLLEDGSYSGLATIYFSITQETKKTALYLPQRSKKVSSHHYGTVVATSQSTILPHFTSLLSLLFFFSTSTLSIAFCDSGSRIFY